jgi:Putative transposase
VAYTKAARAAALPWNQRRERRTAASTSEPDRPAACLNNRPKPRTVSTQFDRLSPSLSTIQWGQTLFLVQRFLRHVLPTGFQKARHYGFLSPNSRVPLDAVRWLIALHHKLVFELRGRVTEAASPRTRIRCAVCGGTMLILVRFECPETYDIDTS